MSKNLYDEYNKMINDSAPDLWERINASIDSQPSAAPDAYKPKKWRPRYSVLTAAAACVCAAILIPVVIISMNGGSKMHSGSMYENAMQDEMHEAAAEQAAPAGETCQVLFEIDGIRDKVNEKRTYTAMVLEDSDDGRFLEGERIYIEYESDTALAAGTYKAELELSKNHDSVYIMTSEPVIL